MTKQEQQLQEFEEQGRQVTISGGIIGSSGIRLSHDAELIIYGSNFAIDDSPIGIGETITSIYGGSWDHEPCRQLTGTLANSDILDSQFQI
jgi:hypothetical protein